MRYDLHQGLFWFLAVALWSIVVLSRAARSPLSPDDGRRSAWRTFGGVLQLFGCGVYLLNYHRTQSEHLATIDFLGGSILLVSAVPLALALPPRYRRWGFGLLLLSHAALWSGLHRLAGWLVVKDHNDFLPWGLPRSTLAAAFAGGFAWQAWPDPKAPSWLHRRLTHFLLVLSVGAATATWINFREEKESREHAVVRARSLSFAIPTEWLEQLPLDETLPRSEAYRTLRRVLRSLREANPDIAYLYLVALQDGRLVYPVSGAKLFVSHIDGKRVVTPEPTEPLEIGSIAPPSFVSAYRAGRSPEPEITSDSTYGPLLSVFTPIGAHPKPNQIMLGTDYTLDVHLTSALWLRHLIEGITLAALALVVLVDRLQQKADAIAAGELARRQAEDRERARNEFVGMVSHELQSPLHALLALTHDLPEPQHRTAIETHLHDLQRLVEDMLQASALQSPQFRLYPQTVSTRHLLREASRAAQQKAEQKGLALSVTCDARVPLRLVTDAMRLRQIIVNLLSNAVKYTPSGNVELSVQATPLTNRGPEWFELHLRFADTGVGLPAEILRNLGAPFQRSPETWSLAHGMGLGLTVARALTEHLAGTLHAQPREPRGTLFSLVLPVQAVAVRVPPSLPHHPRHALIVDDHLTIQGHLAMVLSQLGWQVSTASSLAEARAQLTHPLPAVAFVDHNLTDGDGTALVAELKQRHPATWVVGMTASRDPRVPEAMEVAGIDDFLFKPISQEALVQALGQVVGTPTESPFPREPSGRTLRESYREVIHLAEAGKWSEAGREAHYATNTALCLHRDSPAIPAAQAIESICQERDLPLLRQKLTKFPHPS